MQKIDDFASELDPVATAQAARKQSARARDDADLSWLMQGGARGRRVVRRLLSYTRVDRPTFHANGLQMAHAEGARSVGIFLRDEILRVSPDAYHAMEVEHRVDQEQERADRNDSN